MLLGTAVGQAVVDRVVYGTITIMSVLIVYDGWSNLRLVDALGVIVGPVLAIYVAHVFSAVLTEPVDLGRPPTGREAIKIARAESRFLLLAVPPVVLVVVLNMAGMSLSDCILVVLWVGVGSLGIWGGMAGRRAGYVGWRLGLWVLAGIAVGLLVLAIRVFLQPGKAAAGS